MKMNNSELKKAAQEAAGAAAACVHVHGYAHFDMHGQNVLFVIKENRIDKVKIIDWGKPDGPLGASVQNSKGTFNQHRGGTNVLQKHINNHPGGKSRGKCELPGTTCTRSYSMPEAHKRGYDMIASSAKAHEARTNSRANAARQPVTRATNTTGATPNQATEILRYLRANPGIDRKGVYEVVTKLTNGLTRNQFNKLKEIARTEEDDYENVAYERGMSVDPVFFTEFPSETAWVHPNDPRQIRQDPQQTMQFFKNNPHAEMRNQLIQERLTEAQFDTIKRKAGPGYENVAFRRVNANTAGKVRNAQGAQAQVQGVMNSLLRQQAAVNKQTATNIQAAGKAQQANQGAVKANANGNARKQAKANNAVQANAKAKAQQAKANAKAKAAKKGTIADFVAKISDGTHVTLQSMQRKNQAFKTASQRTELVTALRKVLNQNDKDTMNSLQNLAKGRAADNARLQWLGYMLLHRLPEHCKEGNYGVRRNLPECGKLSTFLMARPIRYNTSNKVVRITGNSSRPPWKLKVGAELAKKLNRMTEGSVWTKSNEPYKPVRRALSPPQDWKRPL